MLSEIRLGRVPVQGIVKVTIDGATLAPSKYRVDDYEWLVRTDDGVWPCCQNLKANTDQTNTFGVDFIWGQNPPPSGVDACIDLATQIVKACVGADCAIPEETASLIRQGETRISVIRADLGKDFQGNLRAGMKSVDRFLTAVPHGRPAVIASPDSDALVRRTG